jgi:hypothetical protein
MEKKQVASSLRMHAQMVLYQAEESVALVQVTPLVLFTMIKKDSVIKTYIQTKLMSCSRMGMVIVVMRKI